MKKVILYSILSLGFLDCSTPPAALPSGKYIGWLEQPDNGLTQHKTIDEITVTAHYRSPEAVALLRTGASPTALEWEAAKQDAGNMQYYYVSYRLQNSSQDILKYNLYDETEYFARSNYLSFGVDKDVYVLCGKDSLPCRIHQFTPHYGLSPKIDIVFAFDEPDQAHQSDRTFVIEDQLFNLGILQFKFSADDIQHIPSIQF